MDTSFEKTPKGPTFKEGEHRQLAYSEEFKQLVQEHKKEQPIKTFVDLEEQLKNPKDIAEEGSMRLTLVSTTARRVYKLDYHGESFFVKRNTTKRNENISSSQDTVHIPNQEATAVELAKDIDFDGENARIVNFQFAFQHGEYSYFVSDWEDLPTLDNIWLERELDWEEIDRITGRWNRMKKVLEREGFVDVNKRNVFYDQENDQFVFFDLHLANPTED